MFNQYIKQLLSLTLVLVCFACKKDLGNYEYTTLNSLGFDGISNSYTVTLGDKLKITPEFKFNKETITDENAYSYQWYAMNVKSADLLPADQRKDIATTRNLDAAIQIPPGDYRFYYSVTDKKTGIVYTAESRLKVETNIFEGWMVLNDVNGTARLDMVSKVKNVYAPITDVLAFTGSELTLKGKPLSVMCFPFRSNFYGISISTDQGTNRIEPETFKWKSTYNLSYEMVSNVPAGFHADFLAPVKEIFAGMCYMYAGENVYYTHNTFGVNYGVPINLVKGEQIGFKPAPFIAAAMNNATGYPMAVLFDTEKKRFLRQGNNESNMATIPKPQTQLFDSSNMGMDMIFMDYTSYANGEVYAILKNPAGKIYLARFSPFTGAQNYFSEITGTGIEQAEKFTLSPVFGYLFYSVGGKLYEYDTSLKTSKLMLDKGAEKITLMKFQYFAPTSNAYYRTKFVLSSFL